MKKLVKIVALLLAVMTVAVAATACSVSGKTYVFDKVEVIATASDVTSSAIDTAKNNAKEGYKDLELVFNADGSWSALENGEEYDDGYWKEKDNRIYLGNEKDFEIDEEDEESYLEKSFVYVILTIKSSNLTVKIYFKLKI